MSVTPFRTRRTGRPLRAARAVAVGMTLIELSIATALSMVVLGGVGYAYVHQRTVHRHQEDLVQIQGTARLALESIGREIRQAGYVGCNSSLARHSEKRVTETVVIPAFDPGTLVAGAENFTIDASNALRVFAASEPAAVWGGAKPANVVAGTQVIEIRYASADGATRLRAAIPATGVEIPTMGQFEAGRGDDTPSSSGRLALLADCQSAMVVSVDSTEATRAITATTPVSSTRCGHASRVGSTCFHWPSASLMPIRVVQYYVADLGSDGRADRRLMSRKRVMSTGDITWNAPQTVIQGVRDLRLTGVGLDEAFPADVAWRVTRVIDETTPTGQTQLAALGAADWPRVVRVDLRLSLQSDRTTAATQRPVIRNFESSFTVRTRATQEAW